MAKYNPMSHVKSSATGSTRNDKGK